MQGAEGCGGAGGSRWTRLHAGHPGYTGHTYYEGEMIKEGNGGDVISLVVKVLKFGQIHIEYHIEQDQENQCQTLIVLRKY